MDIYCIGAVRFQWTLIKPNAVPFITSLYEIDRIIEQKEAEVIRADDTEKEIANQKLIKQKLSCQYHDFKDVFLKATSNQLLSHRLYDLKIELEKDHNLGFSSLYQH